LAAADVPLENSGVRVSCEQLGVVGEVIPERDYEDHHIVSDRAIPRVFEGESARDHAPFRGFIPAVRDEYEDASPENPASCLEAASIASYNADPP
jgi:hypothetical protein